MWWLVDVKQGYVLRFILCEYFTDNSEIYAQQTLMHVIVHVLRFGMGLNMKLMGVN